MRLVVVVWLAVSMPLLSFCLLVIRMKHSTTASSLQTKGARLFACR